MGIVHEQTPPDSSMELSQRLLARWQAGDQRAADRLFRRYADRLVALASSRLSARLVCRVDAQDVVQSAYSSFFLGARAGRFVLRQSGDLWRLLVAITLHKLHHQVERHTAARRDVGIEHHLYDDKLPPDVPPNLIVRDPSPEEAVALAETLDMILERLKAVERHILELKLQGYSVLEIVNQTGRSRPTVNRVLDRVRRELVAGDDPDRPRQ